MHLPRPFLKLVGNLVMREVGQYTYDIVSSLTAIRSFRFAVHRAAANHELGHCVAHHP